MAATFTITVNPTPPAVAGVNSTPICEGASQTLNADFAGAGATYDWYYAGGDNAMGGGDDVLESNAQNPSITPAATSNYYVVVTSASGCIATSNMIAVNVNPVSDPVVVDYVACIGDPTAIAGIQLAATCTAPTGVETRWYDSAGNLVETNSSTYIPAEAASPAVGTYAYFAECYDPVSGLSLIHI